MPGSFIGHWKVENYWCPMFEEEKQHQEEAKTTSVIERENQEKEQRQPIGFTAQMLSQKLRTYSNFKALGIDKVPNFWLKQCTALHLFYAQAFQKLTSGEMETPEWLTTGATTLLAKTIETQLPSKYRPICCLPTTYKLLTGINRDQIYDHLD